MSRVAMVLPKLDEQVESGAIKWHRRKASLAGRERAESHLETASADRSSLDGEQVFGYSPARILL